MSKKSALLIAPVLALAALSMSAGAALAHEGDTSTYEANLGAINGSNATGSVWISLHGDQATVTENVSGLAATFDGAPYPTSNTSTSRVQAFARPLSRHQW
ncbi:hypothetical protein NHF46_12920 [Arthrobacter alpinus]|nr:hypothetical protein [Arthrobacter alpinus]